MAERWTIDGLMELSAAALDVADYGGQASARVREKPDKRTIRYYTTLGLLDRPAEFRGRTAYYSRRHVLQLTAIKRLQAQGMTLVQIQEALAGADDRRLTRWSGVPSDFWETHRFTPPPPPDPDQLLAERKTAAKAEAPPETTGSMRSASFWREAPAPSQSDALALAANQEDEELPAALRPALALTLAEGVTLVLENIALDQLEPAHLAKLAAASEPLVAELRRLKLIS